MTALIIGVTLVILAGGVVVAAAGRGEGLAPREVDDPPIRLPEEGISGDDVRDVRFSTAMRGYRVAEVDEVLQRLAEEIDALRTEVEESRSGVTKPEPS
ncbi:MAG: DivIVA domain-containing protein [Marmoricola sp.]